MKSFIRLLTSFYAFLLRLYPRQFREEFRDEMMVVFTSVLQEVRQRGIRSLAVIWLREVRDLPQSLARAHWHNLYNRESILMKDYKEPDRTLYLGWVVLTAISLPLAYIFSWAIIFLIMAIVGSTIQVGDHTGPTEDVVGSYVLLPMMGLSVGCFQWLILRRYLPRMGWWILATCLGLLLALGISRNLSDLAHSLDFEIDNDLINSFIIVLLGGPIGLLQWFVLRRHVSRAGWWIFASVAGWILAVLVVFGMVAVVDSNYSGTFSEISAHALQFFAVTLVPAIVTSIALWRLLNQTRGGVHKPIF